MNSVVLWLILFIVYALYHYAIVLHSEWCNDAYACLIPPDWHNAYRPCNVALVTEGDSPRTRLNSRNFESPLPNFRGDIEWTYCTHCTRCTHSLSHLSRNLQEPVTAFYMDGGLKFSAWYWKIGRRSSWRCSDWWSVVWCIVRITTPGTVRACGGGV